MFKNIFIVLHMTYAHGINATLSSDMIDGCLQEGAAWTTDLSNMGRGVPDMCALVDLPNRISYIKLGTLPVRAAFCLEYTAIAIFYRSRRGFYVHTNSR